MAEARENGHDAPKHVVAVDGSVNSVVAFDHACDNLPKDARLVVVSGKRGAGDAQEAERDWNATMARFRSRCQFKNRECEFEAVVFNNTTALAKGIEKVAVEKDAVSIVVGSRGLSSTQGLFMGSVSSAVLYAADRPVTVVKK